MREDEIEALLALDNAGLEVGRTGTIQKGLLWEALIRVPRNFHKPDQPDNSAALAFTGYGDTRQEAVANAWQKYQQFASSDAGRQHIIDANGQMMFRV